MSFAKWLIETGLYQKVLPFMSQEDPPNLKKISRYKTPEDYIKATTRGSRKTEVMAQKLIAAPVGSWFVGGENIIEIAPDAFTIPGKTFPNGQVRPPFKIAFVVTQSKEHVNPLNPKYDKYRYRILAFWQGTKPTFTKKDVEFATPLGGLSYIGGYIDTVWVNTDMRGNGLYKALREFATRRGTPGLEPGDTLTSKSYRAAQAKYDWKRAQEMKKPQ